MAKEFGNLWSESWQEYKNKFNLILKISMIYIIPLIIFTALSLFLSMQFFSYTEMNNNFEISPMNSFLGMTGKAIDNFKQNSTIVQSESDYLNSEFDLMYYKWLESNPVYLLTFISITILSLIFYILYNSTLIYTVVKTKKENFKEAFTGGKQFFWKLFGLMAYIFGILFILPILLIILIGYYIIISGSNNPLILLPLILIFFTYLIFLLIFSIYWIFSNYILFDQNTGIINSVKKSMQIVKGRWWNVFGYFLLLMLVLMLITWIITIPAGIINLIASLALYKQNINSYIIISSILDLLVTIFKLVLITPFTVIFLKNFYFDLKKN